MRFSPGKVIAREGILQIFDDICTGMELFYGIFEGGAVTLDEQESAHCIRVMRHRAGDEVNVIDGRGTMALCRLTSDDPRGARAEVLKEYPLWGTHPYDLTVACCPTKNNDRYEWFIEKAVEVGVDRIVPVIGERSERKIYKCDRARKIALSATKQSLKGCIPEICEPVGVKDFIRGCRATLKLIAWCFEGQKQRTSIVDALAGYDGGEIAVMIGPEGDFSPSEAALALECGFIPVHLGPSRLRTETAALAAVQAVYFHCLQ